MLNNNKNKFILKHKIELLFFFVIILLFFLPRLFSIDSYLLGFASSNTGYIGDTIGGITAPIIGLFSSLLVYIAFTEQVKANKELQKFNTEQIRYLKSQDNQNEWNYMNAILDNIKLHFKDLSIADSERQKFEVDSYSDHAAMVKLVSIYNTNRYTSVDPISLQNILHNSTFAYNQIEYLIVKVKESNLSDVDKKYFYISLLRYKINVPNSDAKDVNDFYSKDSEYNLIIDGLENDFKELFRQIERTFIILNSEFPFK